MTVRLPENTLVALADSPDLFSQGKYHIVPASEARISAFDRSFHFGDSIYEVTRTYDGAVYGLDEHMARMENSCRLAMFESDAPLGLDLLRTMILATGKKWCEIFGRKDLYIRWMISRGVGDLNIHRSVSSKPYGFVFVKQLITPTEADFEKGYHYIVSTRLRNDPRAIDPHMKSGNYMNNILALAEARTRGAQDAILLDQQGFVTEGTTNNVYAVIDGTVITAPSEAPILEGITRKKILEDAARRAQIPVVERHYTEKELRQADEIFMSSSIKEIMPITTLDQKPVADGKPGPITRKLAQTFRSVISDTIESAKLPRVYE
jgi:branched-chain amino acid aminotransferase